MEKIDRMITTIDNPLLGLTTMRRMSTLLTIT